MASYDDDRNEARVRLLDAMLAHIAFDGWSLKAMQSGAQDAGMAHADMLRLFPQGPAQALDFWIAETDRRMIERLAGEPADLRIPEKIRRAILIRLELAAPHREAVRRALALQALPHNAPDALKALYRTVDAIWRAAGDTATDFNFYTKRASLAAIYTATLAYWLEDKSEGFAATAAFLDRRLADIGRINSLKSKVTGFLDRLPKGGPLRGSLREGLGRFREFRRGA